MMMMFHLTLIFSFPIELLQSASYLCTLSTTRTAPAKIHLICFSQYVLSTAENQFLSSSIAGKQISFNLRKLSRITWMLWMSKNVTSTFWYASSPSYLQNGMGKLHPINISTKKDHSRWTHKYKEIQWKLPSALCFICYGIRIRPSIHNSQFVRLCIRLHNKRNILFVLGTSFSAHANQWLWASCNRC